LRTLDTRYPPYLHLPVTASVFWALILVDCLVMEAAPNGLICLGQCWRA
jgi:hypothetical protein